jgi:hypothetical protein
MKAWLLTLPLQAKAVLGMAFVAVALIMLLVFMPLLSWNISSVHRIDQAQPRIARLLGFEGSNAALDSALRSSRTAIDGFLHRRQAGEASVGSAAQQQLRRLAEVEGFAVQGSQLMDPAEDEALVDTRIGVDLKGDLDALQGLLSALSQERPFLLPRELKVSAVPVRRGQPPSQEVIVKLVVSAFSLPGERGTS